MDARVVGADGVRREVLANPKVEGTANRTFGGSSLHPSSIACDTGSGAGLRNAERSPSWQSAGWFEQGTSVRTRKRPSDSPWLDGQLTNLTKLQDGGGLFSSGGFFSCRFFYRCLFGNCSFGYWSFLNRFFNGYIFNDGFFGHCFHFGCFFGRYFGFRSFLNGDIGDIGCSSYRSSSTALTAACATGLLTRSRTGAERLDIVVVYQLDERHFGRVAGTLAELDDAEVAALTVFDLSTDLSEQLSDRMLVLQMTEDFTTIVRRVLLTAVDDRLSILTERFGFGQCGRDPLVTDKRRGHRRERRLAMRTRAPKLESFFLVSHGGVLGWRPSGTLRLSFYVFEESIDVHAERQIALFDDRHQFLQGLASEVAELEHLGLFATNEVSDGLDVGRLEAVVGTDRQVQFVNGLIEQFANALNLGVDLFFLFRRLRFAVHLDEQVHVVAQDLGSRSQRILGNRPS